MPIARIIPKAKLAEDSDQQVIIALLKNPKAASNSVCEEIAKDAQAQTLEMLAADAQTPSRPFLRLSEIPNQTEFLLLSFSTQS